MNRIGDTLPSRAAHPNVLGAMATPLNARNRTTTVVRGMLRRNQKNEHGHA
jgi:hypothetical protein